MEPKKKFYLFKKAENFCAVPWAHVKILMNGDVCSCVVGTESFGNIENQSIEQIVSNHKIKKVKTQLINDQKSANCVDCHDQFNNGINRPYSYLREFYNTMFQDVDIDYTDVESFKLSGIDLHWSSICNLKCITCWDKQSSSIAKEQGSPILHVSKEAAQRLTDYIVENQYNLKEIYLSGGEPTLIKHNLNLLQRLDKRDTLQIRINTNLMWKLDNQIIQEIKKFPNVLFTISAEAIGDRFEYIRRDAIWKVFLRNLDSLQGYNFQFRINSTFFVCSALYLIETMDFFKTNYNINDFTINQLQMDHTVIRARNLPEKIKKIVVDKYTATINSSQDNNLIGQLINCLKELNYCSDESYVEYLDSIDLKSGKSWQTLFPELKT